MEIKIKSYSSESSLINSIIFFILGAILFTSAEKVIKIVSIIFGILLVLIAIFNIINFYLTYKNENKETKRFSLIFGIFCLALSVVFIFFSNIVEHFIRYIIGAWILFSGIMRLINVLSYNTKNHKFLPLLIVSILLMLVGIYTIVVGDIILSTVGIIMMIYAAIEIAGFIFYRKGSTESEEPAPGTTTLIVNEELLQENTDEDNNKSIKDVKNVKEKKKKSKKNK